MSDKFVNQLPEITLPLQNTDFIIVSRGGVNVSSATTLNVKDYIYSEDASDRINALLSAEAVNELVDEQAIKNFIVVDMFQTTTQATSNNSLYTELSELSFPVEDGFSYIVEGLLRYESASTTAGIAFAMQTPTGILTGNFEALVAADGVGGGFQGSITASDDVVTTTTVATANTATVARFSAVFVATATGTLTPKFRRGGGTAANISVLAGSHLSYRKV